MPIGLWDDSERNQVQSLVAKLVPQKRVVLVAVRNGHINQVWENQKPEKHRDKCLEELLTPELSNAGLEGS